MEIKYEKKYICIKDKNINLVFSSAERGLNFKRTYEDFDKNIDEVKNKFNLNSVAFLNQIHSDTCYDYDEVEGMIKDGDALITNKKNIALSVFTADCVPILIYDERKGVIGACHSGWKGTLNKVVLKTVNLMKDKYGCTSFKAYVGPHNRVCCYEVGEDLISQFLKDDIYMGVNVSQGKNLNLLNCIKAQLNSVDINEDDIVTIPYCTFCSKDIEFHSYRRDGLESGRNLSFIFMEG